MSGSEKQQKYLRVTDDIRSDLRRKMLATRLAPRKLFEKQPNVPAGVDVAFVSDLLNGEIERTETKILEYLTVICEKEINAYKKEKARQKALIEKRKLAAEKPKRTYYPLPDVYRDKSRDDYEVIPEEKRQKILSEIERTNLSVQKLIKRCGIKSIDPVQISKVARSKQQVARMEDIDKVIGLYEPLPTVERNVRMNIRKTALDFIDKDIKSILQINTS